MFYDDPYALLRTLVVGVLAYVALIILLRVSGKRTLSKWNAFDFVVTIALGSTLATALLSKETTLAQGALAFAVLIGLQLLITWLAVRSKIVQSWIKARPTLLLYQGKLIDEALRSERVTEGEVLAAVRARGFIGLEVVEAVVLETDGGFSVMSRGESESFSALNGVQGFESAHQSAS
jgi:uncharacterized membrane protein YcaP (DUF421 family)